MSKSILVLALICLVVGVVGLIAISSATLEGNWDPMQKLNEIGNPAAQDIAPPAFGPAAARLTNSQFSRNETQNESSNSSVQANSVAQTPAININLENISAMPNPANPGSPVKITAILGNVENMTAYATIRNSMDVQISNVTLERSSDGQYVGTWTASIATDTYNASIEASAPGISKTFNDALQIEVKELGNATINSNIKSTYTKLG